MRDTPAPASSGHRGQHDGTQSAVARLNVNGLLVVAILGRTSSADLLGVPAMDLHLPRKKIAKSTLETVRLILAPMHLHKQLRDVKMLGQDIQRAPDSVSL